MLHVPNQNVEGDGQIQFLQNNGINHSQRNYKKVNKWLQNNNGVHFHLLNSAVRH